MDSQNLLANVQYIQVRSCTTLDSRKGAGLVGLGGGGCSEDSGCVLWR